jgi:hypothetical protein
MMNMSPLTIGNIIGGVVMVGLMYWFIYLSKAQRAVVPEVGAQRIAAATARPDVPAQVFFVTREPPTRTPELQMVPAGQR